MKINVLGSSGSEGPGHNPPAFLVDDFLLFDAGTVSLSLSRQEQCKITHIFLTHAHLDHIKGIPFLVDNIVTGNHGCRLTILSGRDVIADLKKNIFNGRIWPDFSTIPSPDAPVMRYHNLSTTQRYEVRGYKIQAVRVNHTVPAYGYIIENSSENEVVYTGDTGPTEDIWERMSGRRIKVLIVEVSFPDEHQDLALTSGHLTPALLHREMQKMPVIPEKIYVTHLKPFYRKRIKEQIARLNAPQIEVLEDGRLLTV